MSYNYITDIGIPILTIPIVDIVLYKCFGKKARWFQLHSAINFIILYIISNDVYNIINDPYYNIKKIDTKMESYFIILLHIYHFFIVDNLTSMDYFHHFLFIGFGVIPSLFFIKSNIVRLAWLPTCSLPGGIEYFTLSLVKHGKLDKITQKYINTYLYNYIRYPLTIFSPVFTYIAYKNNIFENNSKYILLYLNFLLFFNGAYYNKLTIENYMLTKQI